MKQHVRFCTATDGVRLAYAVYGSGPPLVRVATWLSHLELDWESPVWRHWLQRLAERHTLVRYDERGCGLALRSGYLHVVLRGPAEFDPLPASFGRPTPMWQVGASPTGSVRHGDHPAGGVATP